MCNSYYAIASKFNYGTDKRYGNDKITDIEPVELVVKESSTSRWYYVTYDGKDYSFRM